MIKPLAIVVALIVGLSMSLVGAKKTIIDVSAAGVPSDYPGGFIACPLCRDGFSLKTGEGYSYEYRCEKCGETYRCRKATESGELEVF